MLQQQCVACNLMISNSGSSDGSCTCGHVFTKKKLIGGKRFSEYRAELYSRLENKKQRMLMRKNRQIYGGIQEKTTFERQVWSDERIESKGNIGQQTKVTFVRFNSKVIGKPLNNVPVGKKSRLDKSQATVLQSLLRRFPSALAEINKRLTSQNLLWFSLNTPRRVRSEQLPIIHHQE